MKILRGFALFFLLAPGMAQTGTVLGNGPIRGGGTISGQIAPTLQSIIVLPSSPSIACCTAITHVAQQFQATGIYSDGSSQDLTTAATWTSANPAIAAIGTATPFQQVNAISVGGPVLITATDGLVSGVATITVTAAPPPTLVSIALTPATANQTNGLAVLFTALGTFSDSSTSDVTTATGSAWNSSITGVATIGGIVTSLGRTYRQVNCGNPGSGTSNITETIGAVTSSPVAPVTCTPPSTCGPPTYNCSITNNSTIQPPAVPPQVGSHTCTAGSLTSCGNLLGANTVVDSGASYNSNPISRLTDTTFGNASIAPTAGGSAEELRWNTNSTFLSVRVQNTGGDKFMSFNPSTMAGSRVYTASISSGLGFSGETLWSTVTSTTVYGYGVTSSQIKTLDLSNCVTLPTCGAATPPTASTFYDFKTSANCLGSGFTVTYNDPGGIANGDAAFAETFSNSGGQSGVGTKYIAVYVPGKGCTVLNTVTGAITADPGFAGSAGLTCTPNCTGQVPNWTVTFGAAGFVVHNNQINHSGQWTAITPCNGTVPACGVPCTVTACVDKVAWQIGTNVIAIPTNNLGGHRASGYVTWVNQFNGRFVGRLFTAPSVVTFYGPAVAWNGTIAQHEGWQNVDPSDTYPFFATTFSPTIASYSGPYFNEVIAVVPNTSNTVFRFSPTFNTNKSSAFAIQQAIGEMSQDGRFAMWGSDWGGTLGADNGSGSCTLGGPLGGTNCRGDVFVVKLQ